MFGNKFGKKCFVKMFGITDNGPILCLSVIEIRDAVHTFVSVTYRVL